MYQFVLDPEPRIIVFDFSRFKITDGVDTNRMKINESNVIRLKNDYG